MSVDIATVKRVAHLARLAVRDEDLPRLKGELDAILGFVEQLGEVDVSAVEPMTAVVQQKMKKREDEIADGDIPEKVLANAPRAEDDYFVVPKVVE